MKDLLKIIETKYKNACLDIAVLKSVLYRIASKDNIEDIKSYLELFYQKDLENSKDIRSTTDSKTFLKNLIKDLEEE